jgi:hypothetical protein
MKQYQRCKKNFYRSSWAVQDLKSRGSYTIVTAGIIIYHNALFGENVD